MNVAFELAWNESIGPTGVSNDGGIFIRRSSSFTEDDNIINVEDVAKIITALGDLMMPSLVLKNLGWKNLNAHNSFEMATKIVKTFDLYNQQTISRVLHSFPSV